MKQKLKQKRFMGLMLTLAMVVGLMPGMSLKVWAETTTYTNLIPTASDDESALSSKVVKFNNIDWYIIKDESTAANAGTVTLLAADTSFGLSKFHDSSNDYSNSTVKGVLDGLAGSGGSFADVADTIVTNNDAGGKLYLLSTTEAEKLPEEVLKLDFYDPGEDRPLGWWLRTTGYGTDRGTSYWSSDGFSEYYGVMNKAGVRPALKLDLSKVTFDSNKKTFSVGTPKPSAKVNTAPQAKTLTYTGSAQELVTAGAAEGGTMQYILGPDNTSTPTDGYTTSIPTGTEVGTYYVWYKVIGDDDHSDSEAACVTVTITENNGDIQQNPDGTKTVTKENADGKTISVTNYSKTDEQISQFVFEKAKGTTVDLTNVNSKNLKTVVVPESVKANGNTYKVTRIRKGFLKNCEQATKVDIGKNINTIDKNAFNYGKKVKKVVIRGKLKKVGKNAFKNTKKNVVIKVKTSVKNFEKNKKLLEKSGLPKNATVKRVKNKK